MTRRDTPFEFGINLDQTMQWLSQRFRSIQTHVAIAMTATNMQEDGELRMPNAFMQVMFDIPIRSTAAIREACQE